MKVELINVSKTLKKREVLSNINYTFNSGCIYGIHGKNGSGKTMLLRVISGLIDVTEGVVKIDDDILGETIDFPNKLGLCFADVNLSPKLNAFDNLKALSSINKVRSDEEIREVIRRVGLDSNNNRKLKTYSLGMNQRINFAQAILENPQILILDEPTNGLDDGGIELFHTILKEEKDKGCLIILATHSKEDLEILADVKLYIAEGGISE